jgi:hypothetical protein
VMIGAAEAASLVTRPWPISPPAPVMRTTGLRMNDGDVAHGSDSGRMGAMKTTLLVVAAAVLAGLAAAPSVAPDSRVFELRTYHSTPEKIEALHTRFRDHTNELFKKHGMTLIGQWVPMDADKGSADTLVYMLAFKDRAAATAAWREFARDPEWMKVYADSQKDGALTTKIDSVFMSATDYSPLR